MAKKPEDSPPPVRKKREIEPTFPPDIKPDPEVIPKPPEVEPGRIPEINPPPDTPEIN